MPKSAVHKWYDRRRWRRRARAQLVREPCCSMCMRKHGLVVPATVADHVVPHRGNWNEFWLGKLQSLCASCHSKYKQQDEIRGYAIDIGIDGYPLDPNHPGYHGAVSRYQPRARSRL
jgi:5-methylcytosine-specific restriction protein A